MVMEEIEQDAKNQKEYFLKSEQTRGELQQHITESSQKMEAAQKLFDSNVQDRIQEIKDLKAEIQNLKEKIAEKET